MSRHGRTVAAHLLWIAALMVLLTGCSSEKPHAQLDASELKYVIPQSRSWGGGNPCAGSGCAGPSTVEQLQQRTWMILGAIEQWDSSVAVGTNYGEYESRIIPMNVRIDRVLRGTGSAGQVTFRADRRDISRAADLIDRGHEVWISTGCYSSSDRVCDIVAFDDEGRFGFVGTGAAGFLTIPMAQEANLASAESGRAFMQSVVAAVT